MHSIQRGEIHFANARARGRQLRVDDCAYCRVNIQGVARRVAFEKHFQRVRVHGGECSVYITGVAGTLRDY